MALTPLPTAPVAIFCAPDVFRGLCEHTPRCDGSMIDMGGLGALKIYKDPDMTHGTIDVITSPDLLTLRLAKLRDTDHG